MVYGTLAFCTNGVVLTDDVSVHSVIIRVLNRNAHDLASAMFDMPHVTCSVSCLSHVPYALFTYFSDLKNSYIMFSIKF